MAYGALIVEDEASLARNIKDYLEVDGFEARICADGASALKLFKAFHPDIVLLDLRLPDMDGLDVLRTLRAADQDGRIIILTAHGSVQTAVEAIKAGAYEYIAKPVVLSELKRVIERALNEERTAGALSYYHRREGAGASIDELVGQSPPMLALKARIRQLLAAEATMQGSPPAVLIHGETGTGKELVARAVHFSGRRRRGPFIELNCAALPAQLIEGELFGHERGAFTDAKEKRIGLIEAASGGTLFLDEVGELDLGLQAKLLRVLENRTVRRLGAEREHPVDIRVVAATNRLPRELGEGGRFRPDLFYRLSIISLEAPPLRGRSTDILLLAEHFLRFFARAYVRTVATLTNASKESLCEYEWPGNVRELRNLLEQVVVFHGGGEIDACEFPFVASRKRQPVGNTFRLPDNGIDLEVLESDLIRQALNRTAWNLTQSGRLLNLSRDAMRHRIEKYSLRAEPLDPAP